MKATTLALPLLALVAATTGAASPTAPGAAQPSARPALRIVAQPTAAAQAQDEEEVPAIQVQGDRYILNFPNPGKEVGEGMTLEQFVDACQQVTNINFTYNEETATFLANAKIRLMGTKEVQKDNFYAFFQILMIINDFVCIEKGEGELSIIEIQALASTRQIRSDSILVTPEELDAYANQPATLITTVINLPNTDVRQLSNSMRTMVTDQNTQQMLPAGATNSMVLTGFGSDVVALARMLMIVDEASKLEEVVPQFEVLRLEFAAADEVASLVEELLEAQRTGARGRGQQQGPTGPQANQSEAKILVDPRTNSLLVMAMPDDMPRIKDLVARLDVEIVERERSYHIYSLENVSAEDLAEVLNEFLDNASRVEAQQAPNNPQGGRGGNTGSEFVVVDDAETNSLLIAASRTRYEELLSLIRRLDRRQDQVLIETALIELTSDDLFDIGVELGFAKIPGQPDTQHGFGVTNFGLSTFQDTDGDGLADSRIPNLGTGISAGILDGEDFSLPMLITLVETKQNSNVLNVPSVLVNNNGRARVEALERQPTTTVTTTGTVGGTQENFNDYQDAGIIMEISPSISASNYLRLDLYLQVSTFQGTFTGAIPPPQLERTLETTINVPDGDTMVIGGIVIDNSTETRSQIPWVGDLPILGTLFRRDTNNKSRTALYFFVTPHILEDADFADLADLSYRKKLEAADAISMDRMQKIDPNFGKDKDDGPIDLDSFDLPLYSKPRRGEVDGEQVGLDAIRVHDKLREDTGTGSATFTDGDGDGLPDVRATEATAAPEGQLVIPATPEPAAADDQD